MRQRLWKQHKARLAGLIALVLVTLAVARAQVPKLQYDRKQYDAEVIYRSLPSTGTRADVLRSAPIPPSDYSRKDDIIYIRIYTGNANLHRDEFESLTWDFDDARAVVYFNRQGSVVGKECQPSLEIPDDTLFGRIKRFLGFE